MADVQVIGQDDARVGTVYCIGRNYVAHARELGNEVPDEPVVFLKSAAALRGLQPAPVAFPAESFHHEVEIVVLVGRGIPLGGPAGWDDVRAVALGLDLTRRGVQSRCKEAGLPWTPAKSFAGSGVLGPFVPRPSLGDTSKLAFSLSVNGHLRQRGDVGDMLFDVPSILAHLARQAPMSAGDLVFTGTPSGVGPLAVGDAFSMTLDAPGGTWTFDGVL